MDKALLALADQTQIRLQAVDVARNVRRGYAIDRASDLFGWHIVSWSGGRVGRHGQFRVRAFADEAEAIGFTRQLLSRRSSAPRRIGVAYRHVDPQRPAAQMTDGMA